MSTSSHAQSMPRQIDNRSRLRAVRYQGNRQSCLAFAASAGHELLRFGLLTEELAPEFLVFKARGLGDDPLVGLHATTLQTILQRDGQCLESLYPYDACREQYAAPSVTAISDAGTRRLAAHTITLGPGIDDIRAAVAAAAAVIVGIEYYQSARVLGPDATVPIPAPSEARLGGHALLVAGYDDGQRGLLVRNSYGAGWGDGGYGWLPYDYPARDLLQLWSFTL